MVVVGEVRWVTGRSEGAKERGGGVVWSGDKEKGQTRVKRQRMVGRCEVVEVGQREKEKAEGRQ